MNLTTLFNLNFVKVREVKSPTKSFDADGIDFYVPTNLTLQDFVKNFSIYLNEWLYDNFEVENGVRCVVVPLTFVIKDKNTGEVANIVAKYFENGNTMFRRTDTNAVSSMNIVSTGIIEKIIVNPGSKILIPSGIKVNLPKYIALDATNKSGIASKRGLIVGAELIDQNYQGELHINLINTDIKHSVIINAGDKIVQFLPLFIPKFTEIVEASNEKELFEGTSSTRGENGFGSSGTK